MVVIFGVQWGFNGLHYLIATDATSTCFVLLILITVKKVISFQLAHLFQEGMIAEYLATLMNVPWSTFFTREFLITQCTIIFLRIILFPFIRRLLFTHIRRPLFIRTKRYLVTRIQEPLFARIRGHFFNAPTPTPRTIRCATIAMASPSRPKHMQLQSPLFRLPRELRDQIYGHYLVCETGLEYDFWKNKLTRTNGKHIDLSLIYTCREAAAELQGLALRLNKVVFRTAWAGASRRHNIGTLEIAMKRLNLRKHFQLNEVAQSCLTDETKGVIGLVYPQFAPLLRAWRQEGPIVPLSNQDYTYYTCGEPPSVYRDFVHFALRILEDSPHTSIPFDVRSLPHLEPWQEPDDKALEELLEIAFDKNTRPDLPDVDRCIVSAAACAIRFLNSLPRSIRSEVRQVDLIEDRESVSYPECHVRGLVPFCQDNKELRIHRRVDLWWNVLWKIHRGGNMIPDDRVIRAIAEWMVEATALPSMGMPSNAFKMTFIDSESGLDEVSKIFDVLQQYVAWQIATDLCYERQILPTSTWTKRRLSRGYTYETISQILLDIVNQDSIIHCDFLPGRTHDPEKIVDKFTGESVAEWLAYRVMHHTSGFISKPKNRPSWCPTR